MRRYDPAYRAMKASLEDGGIGEALLMHCVHRNPSAPEHFTREMALTDSVIHEIDTARWLLEDEVVAVSFRAGRRSPLAPVQDPQVVVLETASGVLVDVESFIRCQYGYDVRAELVGSEGTLTLENPLALTTTRSLQRTQPVPPDWKVRFGAAFGAELQGWVEAVRTGEHGGAATAWDGYAATAVAEAGLAALASGERQPVQLAERPAFYRKGTTP
jgi:myo-inositol 2-dehydrogenase/D-chiro-inositol 1-dehydrogenase